MNPVQRWNGGNPVERWNGGTVERNDSPAEAKLRRTALQLEGMFVQRMFAAMRETVPQDGMMAQSNAEATFSSLLDEKLAEQAPTQWSGPHSLAEALYRQLRQRIEPAPSDRSTVPPLDRSTAEPLHRSTAEPLDRSTVEPLNRSTAK